MPPRPIIVRDGRLLVHRDGTGHPVVLIHGWAVDRRMWTPQIPLFRRRFTTLTYDRRGYGDSSCRADLELEADDLKAIFDQLEIERAALVGMSQGGRVALRFARAWPERVSTLVLQGAPLDGLTPPKDPATSIPAARLSALFQSENRSGVAQELSRHAFFATASDGSKIRDLIFRMLQDYRGEDLAPAAIPELPLQAVRHWLRNIAIPTLVVTGSSETPWLSFVSDYAARNIPAARRRVIRGGGHFVNLSHAPEYNHCVADFIDQMTTPFRCR